MNVLREAGSHRKTRGKEEPSPAEAQAPHAAASARIHHSPPSQELPRTERTLCPCSARSSARLPNQEGSSPASPPHAGSCTAPGPRLSRPLPAPCGDSRQAEGCHVPENGSQPGEKCGCSQPGCEESQLLASPSRLQPVHDLPVPSQLVEILPSCPPLPGPHPYRALACLTPVCDGQGGLCRVHFP